MEPRSEKGRRFVIIHQPEIESKNGRIRISAVVDLQNSQINIPDVIWFEVPEDYQEFITNRADGFAVALLLLAMALGENIEVRGVLSPRLAYGMQEYQRVFNCWFPQKFKLIDIKCNNYKSQHESDVLGGVASAFSGGIDSFYTLWSHLPQQQQDPNYRVGYGLFLHGYDIRLEDEATYYTAQQAYAEMMQEQGLRLLVGRTNVYDFVGKLNWALSHGTALVGFAMILGRLLSRFFIPSGYTYKDSNLRGGTDPVLDHLLSTETLEIIHDGASATRVEKTAVVAKWPETYSLLRVCWMKPDGLRNCCECEKCLRTMTTLDMFGSLSKYLTFPQPLERQKIRSCRYIDEYDYIFAQEIIEYATAVGRNDIAADVRYALFRSRIKHRARQIKHHVAAPYKQLLKKTKTLVISR